MKSKTIEIKQGDICLVDFNPTLSDEIKKIRPAIIINGDFAIGLDLKIVAPITTWKNDFEKIWWLYKLVPNKQNGLNVKSAVNCYQIRCISIERIVRKLGNESKELEEIIATAQNCIEIV
ncbi:MAG: type II toxin-antitoxin system PemK/MazF family toxin [Bacteroidetes bacterium]|nr:MAG: type II toxin-antitoxin system PemK/MazF family toxin [Bacteroidota bacterium]